MPQKKPQVAIIMGSKSDFQLMKPAAAILKQFKILYIFEVISAHRTPSEMALFAEKAFHKGIQIIIAGAGGAAHLPGMVAAHTPVPVIGVPLARGKLKGLDALLSIQQMPRGVPVACVSVDGAQNAALLALSFIAFVGNNVTLQKALFRFRNTQRQNVLKNRRVSNK